MSRLFQNVILCHVAKHFPVTRLGRPSCDPTILLHFMILVLQSGMSWRHLQETKCPYDYRTVHNYFRQWTKQSIFKDAYRSLYKLYVTKKKGKYHCIDTSYIKNIYGQDCTGRNPTDRGRLATKLSAIVDDTGVPVSLYLCPGNVSDHKTVQPTLDCRIGRLDSHIPLYADKGYDSKDTRQKIRNAKYIDRVGKRRIWTHRIVNRKRGVVERFFSWLDKYRRLILRYDALISSYESMTWLAACRFVSARI